MYCHGIWDSSLHTRTHKNTDPPEIPHSRNEMHPLSTAAKIPMGGENQLHLSVFANGHLHKLATDLLPKFHICCTVPFYGEMNWTDQALRGHFVNLTYACT